MFESLCGDEFLSNVTLVTTMWGKLSSAAEGDRLEGQLKEKYWKHMIDEGSRCGRYHRDKESGQKLIEELLPALKSNQNAVPRLEKEMLEKGGLANTSAGMALQKRLTNENQMLQRRIRELEKKATEDTPKGRRALEEMVTKQGMLQRNAADEERLKRGTLSRFILNSAAYFGKEVLRDGARFWSNRDDSMINRGARVWDGWLNGAARVVTGTYKPE